MPAVLISDNGPHSADAWANAAAEHIFAISENIADDRLLEAKRVQIGIAMALLPLFKSVMAFPFCLGTGSFPPAVSQGYGNPRSPP